MGILYSELVLPTNSVAAGIAFFGVALAIDGERLAVGSEGERLTIGAPATGTALVFDSVIGPEPLPALSHPATLS